MPWRKAECVQAHRRAVGSESPVGDELCCPAEDLHFCGVEVVFERDVELGLEKRRVQHEVDRRWRQANFPDRRPEATALSALYAQDDLEQVWAGEGLAWRGDVAVIAAQAGSGKTTLALNLACDWIGGTRFLGCFAPNREEDRKRVLFRDYELDRRRFRRWAMDLDIPGDHLSVIFMRQTGMDVTDEEQQAWLVDELDGVGQWIIDP